MIEVLFLFAQFQNVLYTLLAVGGVIYLVRLGLAWRTHQRTPYGLEKEAALQRQNSAVAVLIILGALTVFVYMNSRVIVPNVTVEKATPMPTRPPPTATPIRAQTPPKPLVVDSSGCQNPDVKLTAPETGERISGAYEVRGTARQPGFAFYMLEISGAQTDGAWIPVGVGNREVVNDALGTFDAGAYLPGEYAFRLTVKDTAGNFPPACVVAVTLLALPTAVP